MLVRIHPVKGKKESSVLPYSLTWSVLSNLSDTQRCSQILQQIIYTFNKPRHPSPRPDKLFIFDSMKLTSPSLMLFLN